MTPSIPPVMILPQLLLALLLSPYPASTAATTQLQIPLQTTLSHSNRNIRIQNGIPLLILPLGNSITWGYGSTSGNGYREPLLTLLSPPNPVTYIGSQHSGNMSNDANEGHPGALISQIATYANNSLYLRPNIILLMAGTNDMNIDYEVDTAPQRLVDLVDECVTACPDAAVLVAQLTPILNASAQARVEAFNGAFPPLLEHMVGAGKKVLVVDMENYVTVEDLVDGLHPGDLGYEGMARAWFDGIQTAAEKGWIEKPVGNVHVASRAAPKRDVFSELWGPAGVMGLMLFQLL